MLRMGVFIIIVMRIVSLLLLSIMRMTVSMRLFGLLLLSPMGVTMTTTIAMRVTMTTRS